MSYESPITAVYERIANQITQDFEDRLMAEVKMKVDIDVDKDELIKALDYDRHQYEKGRDDAIKVLKPMCRYLSKCITHPSSAEHTDWCVMYREECNCQCLSIAESVIVKHGGIE